MMLFMFPGQGSQKIGMGKALAGQFSAAREVFDEVDDAVSFKLSKLMFEGDADELKITKNAQPALMTVSMAFIRVMEKDFGIDLSKIKYFAGHSLGEYTALCAAKSLTLRETAIILRIRGAAMSAAYPEGGAMAAIIGLPIEKVEEIVLSLEDVQIANDNSAGQTVVSGTEYAVQNAMKIFKGNGAKLTVLLPVSGPFHSKFMKPAEDTLRDAIKKYTFRPPLAPIISNVTAKAEKDGFKHLLLQQLTNRVRWRESLIFAKNSGVENFIEIGEGNVLSGLVKRTLKDVNTAAVNSIESLENFAKVCGA